MYVSLSLNLKINHQKIIILTSTPLYKGAWLSKSTSSMDIFCCSWLIQAVICPFEQPEKSPYMTSHSQQIFGVHFWWALWCICFWVWPFNSHQRENALHKGIWAWHTDAKWDNPEHVDHVGFPYVLENCHTPVTGGFVCLIFLSGFMYFLLASTKYFIELVDTDFLCHFEDWHAPGQWSRANQFQYAITVSWNVTKSCCCLALCADTCLFISCLVWYTKKLSCSHWSIFILNLWTPL